MDRARLLTLASLALAGCAGAAIRAPTPAGAPATSTPATGSAPAASVVAPPPPPREERIADEVVARVVSDNAPQVRQCYERALAHDFTLEGAVIARVAVSREGAVTAVEDAGSTLADADAVRCVLDLTAKLPFPPPSSEKAVATVTYHFDASATGESKGTAHGCRVRESNRGGTLLTTVACKTRLLTVQDSAGEASAAVARARCDTVKASLSAGETARCGAPIVGGKQCWDAELLVEGYWTRTLLTSPAPGRARIIGCTGLASTAPSAWCNGMTEALVRGKSALEALQAVGP